MIYDRCLPIKKCFSSANKEGLLLGGGLFFFVVHRHLDPYIMISATDELLRMCFALSKSFDWILRMASDSEYP